MSFIAVPGPNLGADNVFQNLFALYKLTFLKSTGQLFFRMSLSLGLADASL